MKKIFPQLAIVFAAILWSFDGLLRQALYNVPSLIIVTIEHIIGAVLFIPFSLFDFRVLIIIFGGLVYFPIIINDIFRISDNSRIDKSYNKIFFENKKPNLPKDHFID